MLKPILSLGPIQVIRNAYATYQSTSDYMAIAPAEPDFLPPSPQAALQSSRGGSEGMSATASETKTGLGMEEQGSISLYPAFRDYPVASMELLRMERERIQASEDALIRRRRVSWVGAIQCTRINAYRH